MYDPRQKQHRLLRLTPNANVVPCLLLTFPIIVHHPILRSVVVRCLCPPTLPLSSTTTVICRCHLCHSHHHHSTISAVSCRPLSSFPSIVCRLILQAVIIRRQHHPPPSTSAITVIVCRHHLQLLQPSSPLCCRWRCSPPSSLPRCIPPPDLACLCCPPPQPLFAPVIIVRRRHL